MCLQAETDMITTDEDVKMELMLCNIYIPVSSALRVVREANSRRVHYPPKTVTLLAESTNHPVMHC